ncbi:hypothetical protein BDZ45DRAFT_415177 [Acephala macrosclerotiorum]|nr:hypothetical protein BDZ45DRAFT_415177 [Acephala macrosclerotiorum]
MREFSCEHIAHRFHAQCIRPLRGSPSLATTLYCPDCAAGENIGNSIDDEPDQEIASTSSIDDEDDAMVNVPSGFTVNDLPAILNAALDIINSFKERQFWKEAPLATVIETVEDFLSILMESGRGSCSFLSTLVQDDEEREAEVQNLLVAFMSQIQQINKRDKEYIAKYDALQTRTPDEQSVGGSLLKAWMNRRALLIQKELSGYLNRLNRLYSKYSNTLSTERSPTTRSRSLSPRPKPSSKEGKLPVDENTEGASSSHTTMLDPISIGSAIITLKLDCGRITQEVNAIRSTVEVAPVIASLSSECSRLYAALSGLQQVFSTTSQIILSNCPLLKRYAPV